MRGMRATLTRTTLLWRKKFQCVSTANVKHGMLGCCRNARLATMHWALQGTQDIAVPQGTAMSPGRCTMRHTHDALGAPPE